MISVKNVTLRRGVKVVLDRASVTFNPGEKIGLVGRNGAGKSSFFALLNGTLHEDSGEFSIPAAWQMAQVAQDMPETEQSATDFVIEGDTVLMAARARLQVFAMNGPAWVTRLMQPKGDIPYGVAIAVGALLAYPSSPLVQAFIAG